MNWAIWSSTGQCTIYNNNVTSQQPSGVRVLLLEVDDLGVDELAGSDGDAHLGEVVDLEHEEGLVRHLLLRKGRPILCQIELRQHRPDPLVQLAVSHLCVVHWVMNL